MTLFFFLSKEHGSNFEVLCTVYKHTYIVKILDFGLRVFFRDGNRSEPRPEKDRVNQKTEKPGNSNQKQVFKWSLIS